MSVDTVRAQYEEFPYPARDPRDEAKRLVVGSPGDPAEVNHYLFAGQRDFSQPFRALFAGGGTGDGTIMMAQRLTDMGSPGEVVYLDLSHASRAVAEARAKARGLTNIRFHTGSLLDAAELGGFDYIDCCGVLHHLPDPAAGLAALAAALNPGGGLGLMLYASYGRSGVYETQDALRRLTSGLDGRGKIAVAKKLLAQLPATNRLKRNTFVGDHVKGGDAGIFDLLLHSQDRAFTVAEVAALTARAGLAVTAFIAPATYDPARHLSDPSLLSRAAALPWIERCALAEALVGSMKTHVFYAAPKALADGRVAMPEADAVPVPNGIDPAALAASLKPGGVLTAKADGAEMRLPVPRLGPAILRRIDGTRSLREIHADMAEAKLGWEDFEAEFTRLYAALNGLNKLLLRR